MQTEEGSLSKSYSPLVAKRQAMIARSVKRGAMEGIVGCLRPFIKAAQEQQMQVC